VDSVWGYYDEPAEVLKEGKTTWIGSSRMRPRKPNLPNWRSVARRNYARKQPTCEERVDKELEDRLADLRKLWELEKKDPDASDEDLGTFNEYGCASITSARTRSSTNLTATSVISFPGAARPMNFDSSATKISGRPESSTGS